MTRRHSYLTHIPKVSLLMAKMTTRAQMVQRKVGTKKRKKGEGRGVGRVTDLI